MWSLPTSIWANKGEVDHYSVDCYCACILHKHLFKTQRLQCGVLWGGGSENLKPNVGLWTPTYFLSNARIFKFIIFELNFQSLLSPSSSMQVLFFIAMGDLWVLFANLIIWMLWLVSVLAGLVSTMDLCGKSWRNSSKLPSALWVVQLSNTFQC